MWLLMTWMACAPEADVQQKTYEDRAREAIELSTPPPEPDCGLIAQCGDLALDAAQCIDDAGVFEVDMFGDVVADIDTDDRQIAALGLPPGSYYGVFPGPVDPCEAVVASFSVLDGGAL